MNFASIVKVNLVQNLSCCNYINSTYEDIYRLFGIE